MNIVVLCGGISTERNVSISSGRRICETLNTVGYKSILVDAYLGIKNVHSTENIFDLGTNTLFEQEFLTSEAPDIEKIRAKRADSFGYFGPGVIDVCKKADLVFIGLHGEDGENGKVQATFDMLGIKYTGSGYLGSMLAMSKELTKSKLRGTKVVVPPGLEIDAKDISDSNEIVMERIINEVGIPLVIKPCNGGSSIGVSIIKDEKEVYNALQECIIYDQKIIVEKYIEGREFSVGVLDGTALPPIEIIPVSGFYDYKNKYQLGCTKEICPASISDTITKLMQNYAKEVCNTLGLEIYSRVDFILSIEGILYCLEANSLPGMTSTSLLPQEARAAGIEYENLCDMIIKLSLKKYEG